MNGATKFAVIGDTHYCWAKHRPSWTRDCPLEATPDYVRYCPMVENVGAPLRRLIAEAAPGLLVSTGDYVEGGLSHDPSAAEEELLEAWKMLSGTGCPTIIAKGTHEGGPGSVGGRIYKERILPLMSASCGKRLDREYFRFDLEGCAFLILDYLSYENGGEQDQWLVRELEDASRSARRIFVFAHPPLYLWGRHFFDSVEFSRRIEELCRKYPVDAYFCGHTHNQSLSFHKTDSEGRGFLQATGSAVGYRNMPIVPLDAYHAVADHGDGNRYLWGILEDSAPGFFLVEVEGETTRLEWHSLLGRSSVIVPGRRQAPKRLAAPSFQKEESTLAAEDLHQVKAGWLNVFGTYACADGSLVSFNGIPLGPLPKNGAYAARRFLNLPENALWSLAQGRRAGLQMPSCDTFAVGSFSLELLLWDGRRIHCPVAPELFVCGDAWRGYRNPERFRWVKPGELAEFDL